MKTSTDIKAVIFDAYGTLFDVYSVGALAEELFPGHGKALANLWRDRQIDYTRIRTLCNQYIDFWEITKDALRFSCAALKLDLTNEKFDKLMEQYAHLAAFSENLGVLEKLKSEGLGLGILSNGTRQMIDSAIDSAQMQGYFDHILTVEAIRKFKTAPEVYQLGPDTFGVDVSEILFVSSNGWDACGATWFGYQTLWVNRAQMPLEELHVTPTVIGSTLEDVFQLIGN
ncbi:MAG: haloacid dehalogenase type II [Rhizobiaceae bacterium]|nr:haloacid dehalogenase type II [Rhizobiaceae bacterium]